MCHKFNFPLGGAETYLFDLCDGLRRLGHTIINFSTSNVRNLYSDYSRYFVKEIDFSKILFCRPIYNFKSGLKFIYSFEAKKNIECLINKYKPDIAHIHNIYHHITPSILKVLKKYGIPIVMTIHDYKLICPNYSLFTRNSPCERCKNGNYFNAIIYKCLQGSYLGSFLGCLEMYFSKIFKLYEDNIDLFIAPSVFVKNKLVDFGIDVKKIYYLPYAINLEGFNPRFNNGRYILYFGNISFKKGIDTLLISAKNFSNTSFKIIGDGPDKVKLELFACREKLANVEFLGYRRREDLADFIRNALFVVIPSKWYEVCGLNIFESFASGKGVIASNIGGIPEFIDDGYTGLLFNPGDPDDLSEKISYLLNNSSKIEELGRNGFERIHRINDQKEHYRILLNIYNQLLTNNN